MSNKNQVKEVAFRKFFKSLGGGIIALFPKEVESRYGYCNSYCGGKRYKDKYSVIVGISRPATPAEYADIKAELENSKKYKLQVSA